MSFYQVENGFRDVFITLELNDVPEMLRVPCDTHARYDALKMKGYLNLSKFGGAQRETPAQAVISYKPHESLRAMFFLSEVARYLITPDEIHGPFELPENVGKIAIFGTPHLTRIRFIGANTNEPVEVTGMSKYQAHQASKGLFIAASKKLREIHDGSVKPVESVEVLLKKIQ